MATGHEMEAARDGAPTMQAPVRDRVTGEVRQETMIINMGPQHPRPTGCSGSSSSWTARP